MSPLKLSLILSILSSAVIADRPVHTTHCQRGKHERIINVVKLRSMVYPWGYEIKIREDEWRAINQGTRCPANSFTLGCSLSAEQASFLPQIDLTQADCSGGYCVYDTGGWEKSPQAVKSKQLPKVVQQLKNSGWDCK